MQLIDYLERNVKILTFVNWSVSETTKTKKKKKGVKQTCLQIIALFNITQVSGRSGSSDVTKLT